MTKEILKQKVKEILKAFKFWEGDLYGMTKGVRGSRKVNNTASM